MRPDPAVDVLLVGPHPPPLGGVSMHVARLAGSLQRRGLRVAVLNHFPSRKSDVVVASLRRNPFRYWAELRRREARVVHLHYSGRPATLLAAAAARRAGRGRWVLSVHSHALDRVPTALHRLMRWALRRMDVIIAVSPQVAGSIRSITAEADIAVIPAYLPPTESETVAEPGWPAAEFIDRDGPCLLVSAYRVRPRAGGGDLYGLDLAVDLLIELQASFPDLRLAMFLSHPPRRGGERSYLEQQLERAPRAGLADRVACFSEARLLPAFRHRPSVYLRPTRTDGDAVSVREAQALGVPVIASDVTGRPPGTMVLSLADRRRWCQAVAEALPGAPRQPPVSRPDSVLRHLRVYGLEDPEAAAQARRIASGPMSGPPPKSRRYRTAERLASTIYPRTWIALTDRPAAVDRPRWGHGQSRHRRLTEILARHDDVYSRQLDALLAYEPDLARIPVRPDDPREPHWRSGFLFGMDGASLYGFVRERQPARYVEVGSGNSTLFVDRARRDGDLKVEITSVDPQPRREVDAVCDRVVRKPLEQTDLAEIFAGLGPGDVVFFDGTHRVFMNSDAVTFFLDVLPELPSGVLCGIHDVHIPDDYKPEQAPFRYSEQYLLAALLLGEPDWLRPMLPLWYVATHPEMGPRARAPFEPGRQDTIDSRGVIFWAEISRP